MPWLQRLGNRKVGLLKTKGEHCEEGGHLFDETLYLRGQQGDWAGVWWASL
jgi:hypothetical protein